MVSMLVALGINILLRTAARNIRVIIIVTIIFFILLMAWSLDIALKYFFAVTTIIIQSA